jgi:hypothetical protein
MEESMSRRQRTKNKKPALLEYERSQLAPIDEARTKVAATKPALDTRISVDSLSVVEERMRDCYFRARALEARGTNVDWGALDEAWEQAGKWAEKVANFRHAKIAAVKVAGDPNEKILSEQTVDQLKQALMADLKKLADVIDFTELAGRSKRPN